VSLSKKKLKDDFQALIMKGINISRNAQEGDAIYRDLDQIDESLRNFNIWKIEIKEFVNLLDVIPLDWLGFYEADSVPMLKGGIEYGDVQSIKSQELLRNIRTETNKKLDLLKKLMDHVFENKILLKDKEIKIIFYKKNAILSINSTDLSFLEGSLEWSLLTVLVDNQRPISFDEVFDYHNRDHNNSDSNSEKFNYKKQKKALYDSHRKINAKVQKKTELKTNLIKSKKNQYTFMKKVTEK